MKNFIELTSRNGEKFLAGLSHIQTIQEFKGEYENENTYIVGLNNNGGFFIKETYEEVLEKIKLHDEKYK